MSKGKMSKVLDNMVVIRIGSLAITRDMYRKAKEEVEVYNKEHNVHYTPVSHIAFEYAKTLSLEEESKFWDAYREWKAEERKSAIENRHRRFMDWVETL